MTQHARTSASHASANLPTSQTFKNFIGRRVGRARAPAPTSRTAIRPTPDDLIGRFPDSDPRDVDAAVRSAKRGFALWSRTPAPARGDVLRRVGDLLVERKEAIADAMTREMGKVLAETRGDVQEGIDTAYYAATEGRRLFGHVVPSELRSKWAMSYRRPIGVVGLITPFNFPLAIPTWKMFPALLCGNSVIIKPSEDVPHTVHLLVEILLEAGLPPEVIQLVHGRGETVGKALVEHPEVPVISFTGSTETGAIIGETCGRMHKRLSLEMGGKNAMIVMDDADLDLALEGVLWGAFGTTGQRCTATSRLILHRKVHDGFCAGWPTRPRRCGWATAEPSKTDVGPLIHEASREKVERYVEIGRKEGAELVTGGKAPAGRSLTRGWFYRPTVFAGVKPESRLEQEEIFGPVLSVIRVGLVRRGGAGQQRRALRALQLDLHRQRGPGLPRDAGAGQRHHLRQRADHRRRGAPAVRRGQGDRQRAPRGRLGGLRVLLRDQGVLRGLLGQAAAGADRHLRRVVQSQSACRADRQ